jgi:transcriptional regulator with GAF, ATPase, and Fis domain
MNSSPTDVTFRAGGTQVRRSGGKVTLVSHRLRVQVVEGPETGRTFDIAAPHAVVGTSSVCDIIIRDPEVSRRHCVIEVQQGAYQIRDLGSTNGTFLEDVRVADAEIPAGGRVRIGSTQLLFKPKKKWLRLEPSDATEFGGLVGTSEAMRSLFGLLARVAPTGLFCVLHGETGTGKELTARALHQHSPRASAPFVVVDCAAISENLAESELLGHERGAFTGADRARPSPFELADGGTVFLDEVGDLPLSIQPKLLRVLERREIKRLGASQFVDVDVRVIAATHRDLEAMVTKGTFREDLYYRLAEVVVDLPPLRERPEDIEPLAEHLLKDEVRHGSAGRRLSREAVNVLRRHAWPGNIRELRNVIRRAAALAQSEAILVGDLRVGPVPQADVRAPGGVPSAPTLGLPRELSVLPLREARERWNRELERAYVDQLLDRCGGNFERAAAEAGVHLKSLQRLTRQLGMRQS